ncbi:MAG: hypothetical protein N4A33_04765 [Bacteriovoracaceae bacterium]|jgi:hypothetical protein|nr:hypothetical protein [Bacteriovoracaceae bacterium]
MKILFISLLYLVPAFSSYITTCKTDFPNTDFALLRSKNNIENYLVFIENKKPSPVLIDDKLIVKQDAYLYSSNQIKFYLNRIHGTGRIQINKFDIKLTECTDINKKNNGEPI